jgi:hypothetical protein
MKAEQKTWISILEVNTRLFKNVLEGINDSRAQKPVWSQSNPVAFIALHLVDARFVLARLVGDESENPYAQKYGDITNADEIDSYPSLKELLRNWKMISDRIHRAFVQLPPRALRQPCPYDFPIEDPSLFAGLYFMLHHESYHIGQIGLMRKGHGLSAMRYEA